jgi:hypothetical protein
LILNRAASEGVRRGLTENQPIISDDDAENGPYFASGSRAALNPTICQTRYCDAKETCLGSSNRRRATRSSSEIVFMKHRALVHRDETSLNFNRNGSLQGKPLLLSSTQFVLFPRGSTKPFFKAMQILRTKKLGCAFWNARKVVIDGHVQEGIQFLREPIDNLGTPA